MPNLRTYVYIDGFNVYYGAVRRTPYKWLDYGAAMRALLRPNHDIQRIKYFTARISGKFDPDAPTRQDAYLRALQAHIPELRVHFGHFLIHPKTARLVEPPNQHVRVLVPEEKGSDVNLAVHLLNDAWRDLFDAAFVVSNDSDLAEAIRLVRQQHHKMVGVVVPGDTRPAAVELTKVANPILRLRTGVLASSQLPNPIPGTTIRKPPSW